MKQMTWTVGITAVLGIVGFFLLSSSKKPPAQVVMQKDTMVKKDTVSMTGEKVVARYIPYSKEEYEKAATTRRVFFFYANWCPICRPANESFQKNANKIPKDVTLMRINYNDDETDQEEKDLAAKYGITYQHTFVQIDSEGKEIIKWNGGQIEELLTNLR